jgi:predicted transposase/invertase (TIGR01784 family)
MRNTPFTDPPFVIYIPFTSDFGFKATFGNEHNTLFLRRALQALIKSNIPIHTVSLSQNVFSGKTKDSRGGVYDLVCEDEAGNIFIVEMQLADYPQFIERMKFYSSQKILPYIKRGKEFKFENLPKIYTIGILDFELYMDDDYYRNGSICDEKGRKMDRQSEFIVVELGKFKKKSDVCTTDLDKLIYTMKEGHRIRKTGEKPIFMQEDWLESALVELDTKGMSVTQYTDMQIAIAREMTRRHGHEWALEAREKKGIEKGKIEKIASLIRNCPDWSDEKIADVLEEPMSLVKKVRQDFLRKENM